jgi:uncharacterized protein (DUF697 family)
MINFDVICRIYSLLDLIITSWLVNENFFRRVKMISETELESMDKIANKAIAGWSFGALAANLLPPPFDMIAVGTVFAKLGTRIGEIYGVTVNWDVIKNIGLSMAKGIGVVIGAGYVGTGLLKYVPGVNLAVALLIQPPMVAAVSVSVGNAFKKYYRVYLTEGKNLTADEMKEMASALLKEKLR